VGTSKNSPHLTPWLSLEQFAGFFKEILEFYPLGLLGQIGGYFLKVPTPYPLGAVGANWWVLSKRPRMCLPGMFGANRWALSQRTHPLLGGFFGGSLVGTFKEYPAWTHQVKWGRIVSEPTMNSQWACWVSDPLPPVSFRQVPIIPHSATPTNTNQPHQL